MATSKTCRRCGQDLPVGAFAVHVSGCLQSWCKACNVAYNRAKRRNLREERQAMQERNALHGLSLDTYLQLFQAQDGECAICNRPESLLTSEGKPCALVVDYDHCVGQVRGLLCRACNHALGSMDEDIARFEQAAHYLRKHAAV